jgi:hypothetical protein
MQQNNYGYMDSMPMPQAQPVSQDEIYASMVQEERVKNVISQISPQMHLNDIRMNLRGYYKDELRQKWIKIDPNTPEPDPLLVSRYMAFLGSVLNTNTILGNLSERQINKIMKIIIEYVTDDLDVNATAYNLEEDYTERTRIGNIMIISVFTVLLRALNGQEARRMWNSLSMSESLNGMGMMGGKPQSKWWQFWK